MFESVLFLISWITFLALSWVMLRACQLSITVPTIPSVVYIYYITFNYLGLPLLYFYKIEHLYNLGVQNRDILWFLWMINSGCILLLLSGYLSARNLLGLKSERMNIRIIENAKVYYFEIIVLLLIILVVYIRFQGLAEFIPILELYGVDTESLQFLRSDAQQFSGKLWRYKLLFDDVTPFVVYYLLAIFLINRSYKILPLFILTFAAACFFSMMNLHKGALIHFLVGILLVFITYRKKVISISKILITIVVGFSLMISMYVFFGGKQINSKLFTSPAKRILTGELGSAYFYLKIFPQDHDFLDGRSLPNPGGIFDFEPFPLTKYVKGYIRPELSEKGIRGSAPAAYWAGIYANFGIPAVILSSFLLGIIIYGMHWFLYKAPLTPYTIALIAWLAVHYGKLSLTLIGTFLADTSLFAVILCYLFFKFGPPIRYLLFNKLLGTNTLSGIVDERYRT